MRPTSPRLTSLGPMGMVVEGIWRYPVKSMGGEQLTRAEVTERGLAGDRAFAVVDLEDEKIASAKNPPKWAELLQFQASWSGDGQARITFPDGSARSTADPDIAEALSDRLHRRVRLDSVAVPGSVFEEVWPDIPDLAPAEVVSATNVGTTEDGEAVSQFNIAMGAAPGTFFDVAPLHILTTATLSRLRQLAPAATFDVRRYRPNFLVGGEADPGFPENGWSGRKLNLGEVDIEITFPTMRCVMTTLGQGPLPQDRDTLRTIATHNRVQITGLGTWACAGAYANVVKPGVVAVGNSVSLD
jgi:uncharacterized protein